VEGSAQLAALPRGSTGRVPIPRAEREQRRDQGDDDGQRSHGSGIGSLALASRLGGIGRRGSRTPPNVGHGGNWPSAPVVDAAVQSNLTLVAAEAAVK
jgi:hypothetical protein